MVIVATAVLHNIAIDNEDVEPPNDPEVIIPIYDDVPNRRPNVFENQHNNRRRNVIINNYFGGN